MPHIQHASDGSQNSNGSSNNRTTAPLTVGLIPAPDMPEQVVDKIRDDLPALLHHYVDDRREWSIDTITDSMIGAEDDTEQIIDKAETIKNERHWHYVICITDLPMLRNHQITVAEASGQRGAAVLSLPALGTVPMRRRVREAILQLANEMHHGSSDQARERQQSRVEQNRADYRQYGMQNTDARKLVDRRLMGYISPIERVTPEQGSVDVRFIAVRRLQAYGQLLSGMVMANRPWTILPAFKRVVAMAFATGVYGLIFPTLWRISDAYDPLRFITLMLCSIVAMMAWITLDHDLWEPRGNDLELTWLYNITTLATLFIGVICYYTTLFVMFYLAVAVFVPDDLLNSTLGHPATLGSYPALAWLVTSVATIAGALGSSLESDETVRHATYGYRQKKRHEKICEANSKQSETS
ncbi:hypothetical protein V5738_03150 [Salinisphaera sp. SPP-AMP-43]|uniref:hypothetical protein n=1 Tax=Salinisphaera sp. SPP-AMP-43 TaxID=3121288 RepID=UPI003C6E18AA